MILSSPPGPPARANWPTATTRASGASSCERLATTPPVNRSGNELHALLAVDGDPAADLEPATVDLYDSLSTPKRSAPEVVVLQDDDDAVIPTRQAV